MLGTWVNVAAVLIGGFIGLLIQKGLSQRLADTLMKGLALCTITIGISGALGGSDTPQVNFVGCHRGAAG